MATAMTGTPLRVATAPRQTVRRATGSVRVQASSRVDQFSKSDIIVSPSILSANFAKLGEQVRWQAVDMCLSEDRLCIVVSQ